MAKQESKPQPLTVISGTCRVEGVHIPAFTVVGEIDGDGNITATDPRITRGHIIPRKRAGEIVPGDPADLKKRMNLGTAEARGAKGASEGEGDAPEGGKKGGKQDDSK